MKTWVIVSAFNLELSRKKNCLGFVVHGGNESSEFLIMREGRWGGRHSENQSLRNALAATMYSV